MLYPSKKKLREHNIPLPEKTVRLGRGNREDFLIKPSVNVYSKGDIIYSKGDTDKSIYLIHNGTVKIGNYSELGRRRKKATEILFSGDLFGEQVLLDEKDRSGFAQVLEDGTFIISYSLEEIKTMIELDNEFVIDLLSTLRKRLEKLSNKHDSINLNNVLTRVKEFLKHLKEKKGCQVGCEFIIELELIHQDIADIIGTSRQTVTMILNELRKDNLIDFDRKRITIKKL